MKGAAYTHETVLPLIGGPVKATVFYQLDGGIDPMPDIEVVITEYENDITHLLNCQLFERVLIYGPMGAYDPGWQDPIRTAMFGLVDRRHAQPGERSWTTPVKPMLIVQGETIAERIINEICVAPGFVAVCRDEACRGD